MNHFKESLLKSFGKILTKDKTLMNQADKKSDIEKIELALAEIAKLLPILQAYFQGNRFNKSGGLSLKIEAVGMTPLQIVEGDVWEAIIRILHELDSHLTKDDAPDAFGLLQDHFEKHELPDIDKVRIGHAFLAFRARMGSIPMSWVPGSPESEVSLSEVFGIV